MHKRLIFSVVIVFIIGISLGVYAQTPGQTEAGPVRIEKGWNLLYGFTSPYVFDNKDLSPKESPIKAVYAFIPSTQQYVRTYPNPENDKIDKIPDAEFYNIAFWVYSNQSFETEYWLQKEIPMNQRILYTGWNFIGITPDMRGKTINQFRGNCTFVKAYVYSDITGDEKNEWVELDERFLSYEQLQDDADFWIGLVVRVNENCHLGEPQLSQEEIEGVPQIPQ